MGRTGALDHLGRLTLVASVGQQSGELDLPSWGSRKNPTPAGNTKRSLPFQEVKSPFGQEWQKPIAVLPGDPDPLSRWFLASAWQNLCQP